MQDKTTMITKNTNQLFNKLLNQSDRFAIWITEKVGTMGFFSVIFFWTVGWLSWNMFAPETLRFDPYPAFVLWLFMSNMIQICLMPLIMVGQNLQSKHAEIRAENDYEVNVRSELEINEIRKEIQEIKELLLELSKARR
jgi:uncharacterized membrane protein